MLGTSSDHQRLPCLARPFDRATVLGRFKAKPPSAVAREARSPEPACAPWRANVPARGAPGAKENDNVADSSVCSRNCPLFGPRRPGLTLGPWTGSGSATRRPASSSTSPRGTAPGTVISRQRLRHGPRLHLRNRCGARARCSLGLHPRRTHRRRSRPHRSSLTSSHALTVGGARALRPHLSPRRQPVQRSRDAIQRRQDELVPFDVAPRCRELERAMFRASSFKRRTKPQPGVAVPVS